MNMIHLIGDAEAMETNSNNGGDDRDQRCFLSAGCFYPLQPLLGSTNQPKVFNTVTVVTIRT
jgi:hypothetical protein